MLGAFALVLGAGWALGEALVEDAARGSLRAIVGATAVRPRPALPVRRSNDALLSTMRPCASVTSTDSSIASSTTPSRASWARTASSRSVS